MVEMGVFSNELKKKWFMTNMRAIKQFIASKDNPQEKFVAIGWLDLSDSVIMNRIRKSKGNRVGSFAGVSCGGVFAGTGAGASSGTSVHSDREVLRFQCISDPNDVNRLSKPSRKNM